MMQVWFPVVTLIIGYILNSISETVRHRRAIEREREAREAERRDKAFERRVSFQRATLLELQDAVMDLMRTTGKMHHQDVMALKQTGQWQKQRYGEEIDEAHRVTNARTTVLRVRVRDPEVRNLIARLKDHAGDTLINRLPDASEAASDQMSELFVELNERIGELLRELDDKDDAAVQFVGKPQ